MEINIEALQRKKFIFIGGAPRSGTTLLCNLMDSHPELLVFPLEHSTVEQFFWHSGNLEFFRNTFIFHRSSGQQSIMATDKELEKYRHKILNEYQKEFDLNVDTALYCSGYLEYLESHGIELRTILEALVFGLVKGNEFARRKLETAKYVVFKQPFYTELFASFTYNHLPESKFVHILRNPVARYASAKQRRIDLHKLNNKRLSHINRVNFVLGHTELDISTRILADKNLHQIGSESYRIVKFKDMLSDRENFFKELSLWLKIEFNHSFFEKPTRLGKLAIAGSKLVQGKNVDIRAIERKDHYLAITSKTERKLHHYYLSLNNKGSQNDSKIFAALFSLLFPFYLSSFKHYVYQILTMPHLFFLDRSRLIEGVKKKKLSLSGAT